MEREFECVSEREREGMRESERLCVCVCKRETEREQGGEVMASVFESVSERRDGTQQNINSEKIKKVTK